MPIFNCPECGKELPELVCVCDNCGFAIKRKKRNKKIIIISAILLALILGFVCIRGGLFSDQIPFSRAKWHDSQDRIAALEGTPDEEDDSEYYGHYLRYEGVVFDGYTGSVSYFFENGELTRVFFVIDGYNQDAYDHFFNKYSAKYGKPDFENIAGIRWDNMRGSVSITATQAFGGIININYMAPN